MDRKSVIWWFWMILGFFALRSGRFDLAGSAFGFGAMHLWSDELYEREKRGVSE